MMAKQLDPVIAEVLKSYGIGHEACWNCHGTWVVYHRFLEQIAAKANIHFDAPLIVEADGAKKIAALCVTGTLKDKTEWSIGEAAPGNNKNAYPWAMAEKRGKDRVILKLIGLHGLAYSEEEADDFKYKGADLTHESDQRMADNIAAYTKKTTDVSGFSRNEQEWKGWSKIFRKIIDTCKATSEITASLKAADEILKACKKASPDMHEYLLDYAQGRREILETPIVDMPNEITGSG